MDLSRVCWEALLGGPRQQPAWKFAPVNIFMIEGWWMCMCAFYHKLAIVQQKCLHTTINKHICGSKILYFKTNKDCINSIHSGSTCKWLTYNSWLHDHSVAVDWTKLMLECNGPLVRISIYQSLDIQHWICLSPLKKRILATIKSVQILLMVFTKRSCHHEIPRK